MEQQSFLGKVKTYNRQKQFGFIVRLSDKKEFFVHRTAIQIHDGIEYPEHIFPRLFPGEYVEFTVDEHTPPGKKLENVKTVTGPQNWTIHFEDDAIQKELKKIRKQKKPTDNGSSDTVVDSGSADPVVSN